MLPRLIGQPRRHQGAPAGPPQKQPQAAGAGPLPRRVLPVADRRRAGAGDRIARSPLPPSAARRTGAPTGRPPPCPAHAATPAAELIQAVSAKVEIETAHLGWESTVLGVRVLRARTPAGIAQEGLRPADLLPDPAYRHHRRHRGRQGGIDPDQRQGQAHHRPQRRPRPAHPGSRRHRRHHHRPDRRHRPPGAGQPTTRPAAAPQPPHRQTRDLQIPSQRPQHQPAQLQSHHQHQHPHRASTLTRSHRTWPTWLWCWPRPETQNWP